MTTIWWSFYFMKRPDENRRFDTIVGKNKRNALRAVRALRVVSATNNPSGAAKIINDPFGSFFILPKAPRRMRQSANGTHGEYADKQLANPQKRICYIGVFAWRLIIVYQGGEWGCQNKQNRIFAVFFFVFQHFHCKLGIKNTNRFTHLRTFKKKRLEI